MTTDDIMAQSDISLTQAEEVQDARSVSQLSVFWQRLRRNPQAVWGIGLFLAIVLMALCAPLITPGVTPNRSFAPEEGYRFAVFGPTFDQFPARIFGTTSPAFAQTSVLAQITFGARPTLFISVISALLASLIGTAIGAISG